MLGLPYLGDEHAALRVADVRAALGHHGVEVGDEVLALREGQGCVGFGAEDFPVGCRPKFLVPVSTPRLSRALGVRAKKQGLRV